MLRICFRSRTAIALLINRFNMLVMLSNSNREAAKVAIKGSVKYDLHITDEI